MNNGYNFIPNTSFIRPMRTPYIIAPRTPLPRISSLLGRTPNANTSKITFSNILNGASKTLGVINQAIPVFYQVKPIWNNARTMFKVVKGLKNVEPIQKSTNNSQIKPSQNTKKEQTNAPTFFA